LSIFHDNFEALFTAEERDSEVYRILAAIGVNVEKAIYEEINAEIRKSTEAMAFTDQKLRSWLAFFLTPVRNVISSRGIGTIKITKKNGTGSIPIDADKAVLVGNNGKSYSLQTSLLLNDVGEEKSFSFIQGTNVTTDSQQYSEFLSFPVQENAIDLSDLQVFYGDSKKGGGTPIPLAPPFLDMPGLLSYFKDFGSKEVGEVFNELSLLWNSVKGVSVRPFEGFFPFVYNNTLYIKIFYQPGGSSTVSVPDNKMVYVTYRLSDGAAGNLGANQLQGFQDALVCSGNNGSVEYEITNEPAMSGSNLPSHAELVNLLRRRFFASTHVSSIPEYTAWFLSQPEVGDCLIMTDFLRWRLSRSTTFTGFNFSGVVEVYLLDKDGELIDPSSGGDGHDMVFGEGGLDQRLATVRDVAFMNYLEPTVYWHYYIIQYRSVNDEASFIVDTDTALSMVYSVDYVKNNNSSLFNDFDVENLSQLIRKTQNPVGLRIVPYHYHEEPYLLGVNSAQDSSKLAFSHFFGEKPGGWYEFWEYNFSTGEFGKYNAGGDFSTDGPKAIFREFVGVAGDCSIYRYVQKHKSLNNDQVIWDWTSLDGDKSTALVGYRDAVISGSGDYSGGIYFSMGSYRPLNSESDVSFKPGVMRCFWCVVNEGMVPVGGDGSSNFGVRKLPTKGSMPLPDGRTYFDDKVRYEKYI